MSTIPNPPNAPAGYIPEWDGTEWKIVEIPTEIRPAPPHGLPEGYSYKWDDDHWEVLPPVTPPAPTPDQVTGMTIMVAVQDLQTIAYLTTSEMGQHITPESRQEVTDYIHAVANILATAQTKYGTGEAYAPTFPPMPTALPQLGGDGLPAPFIQFIVVN